MPRVGAAIMGPLSIGAVAERSGLAVSALRFYEAHDLISSTRTDGGQRRYPATCCGGSR